VLHDEPGIPGSPEGKVLSGLSPAELRLYRSGHTLGLEGRPEEAIAAYRQLVMRRPDLADVWSELVSLYSLTRAWSQALTAARQLVQLRPEDALAWHNLAALLQNHSRPVEAIPAFREALRLDGGMARAWHGLGCAHRAQGQHREALSAFQQAVRFDPDLAQAWHRLGNLHEHYEDYPDAIRAYREAVRAKRDYAAAWYSLGVLCRDEGQIAQALTAFLEAIHFRPHDTDTWLGLGITYAKQRDRKGVLDVFEELALLDPAAAEAFATQYVNNWPEAPETILALPPASPRRAPVQGKKAALHPLAETWYEIGVLHRRDGKAAEAISDFVEAVRFDPDHAKAWFCLAALYRAQSRIDEALGALREVIRLKPHLPAAWRDLATIQSQRGQHQKALKALGKVVQLQPEDAGAWCALARECIALDDADGLASVIARLRGLDPVAAERIVLEHATFAARRESVSAVAVALASPLDMKPAASATDDTAAATKAASSFDSWLYSIDQPPFLPGHAGLEHATRH
jgi:tetratricopeptide (TPR) repeat protein